jgi:hypothetical protein
MAREWQSGDVAVLTFAKHEAAVAVRCPHPRKGGYWQHSGEFGSGSAYDDIGGFTVRPLVVIDAEDREQVERLVQAWERQTGESAFSNTGRYLQAALREFANPTPPRPEEPTGLGAVVEADFVTEDGKGFGPAHWAKAGDGSWVCLTDGHARSGTAWPFLSNVRVLSGGVS